MGTQKAFSTRNTQHSVRACSPWSSIGSLELAVTVQGGYVAFLDPFKLRATSASETWRRRLPGVGPPGPAAIREEAAPVWPRVATACVNLPANKTNTAPAPSARPPTRKRQRGSLNKRQLICEPQGEVASSSLGLISAYTKHEHILFATVGFTPHPNWRFSSEQ